MNNGPQPTAQGTSLLIRSLGGIAHDYALALQDAASETYGEDVERMARKARTKLDAELEALIAGLQAAVPSATTALDAKQIKALMVKHRIWIEHSTLYEGNLPPRELCAVQAEQHQFEAYTKDLISLAATQPAAQGMDADSFAQTMSDWGHGDAEDAARWRHTLAHRLTLSPRHLRTDEEVCADIDADLAAQSKQGEDKHEKL